MPVRRLLVWTILLLVGLWSGIAVAQDRETAEFVPQVGHTGDIVALSASPDGRYALTGSTDGTLKLWDVAAGKEIRTMAGHVGTVTGVVLAADAHSALSAGDDGTIRLWDTEKGTELRNQAVSHKPLSALVATADLTLIVAGGEDGNLYADTTRLQQPPRPFAQGTAPVKALAMNARGKQLLVGRNDGELSLWGSDRKSALWVRSSGPAITALSLPGEGDTAIVGRSDGGIGVWNLKEGRQIRAMETGNTQQKESISDLSLSPDGNLAISASDAVRLWDVQSGRLTSIFAGHGRKVATVKLLGDNKTVLSTGGAALIAWDRAATPEPRVFSIPGVKLRSLAISADGSKLLSGGADGSLGVWDAATGHLLRSFIGHTKPVLAVALSPNGDLALSTGVDGTIRLWRTDTGTLQAILAEGVHSYFLSFSRDGEMAVANDGSKGLRIWNVISGQQIGAVEGDPYFCGWSSDGRAVIFIKDNRLISYSPQNDPSQNVIAQLPKGFSWGVIANDGTQILGSYGNKITRFDIKTGETISLADLGDFGNVGRTGSEITDLSLSQNDKILAVTDFNGTAMIYNISTGKLSRAAKSSIIAPRAGVFSTKGENYYFIDGSGISAFQTEAPGESRIFGGQSVYATAPAISPDGHSALVGYRDGTLQVWSLESGKQLHRYQSQLGAVTAVKFLPDGKQAVIGEEDGTITIRDLTNGSTINTLRGHTGEILALDVSRDGQFIVSGGLDKTVRLWDRKGGQLRSYDGHQAMVEAVGFSPDGTKIISADGNGQAAIWDATSGKILHALEAEGAYELHSAAFSPDGDQVLTAGYDRVLRIWSANTGRLAQAFPMKSYDLRSDRQGRGSDQLVAYQTYKDGKVVETVVPDGALIIWAAFAPDGKSVISVHADRTIHRRILASGEETTWFWPYGFIRNAALSPDGNRLLTTGKDNIAHLLTFTRLEAPLSMLAMRNGDWVSWLPAGFFDGAGGGPAEVTVVHGMQAYTIDQMKQQLYRPDLLEAELAGDPNGTAATATSQLDLVKVLSSGPPPTLRLTPPAADGSPVPQVQAEVADTGGGIGRVEWRVNGVTLGVETRGLSRIDAVEALDAAKPGNGKGAAAPLRFSRRLDLGPGDNLIEVTAYNGANLIESHVARLTLRGGTPANTSEGQPRLFIIAAGINEYWDSQLRLAFAASDARAIADSFKKANTGLFAETTSVTLLDDQVTTKGLDAAFADIAKTMTPQDVFIFFLAGHGKTQDGRFYFIPYDFRFQGPKSLENSAIGQDQLQRWLASIPARHSVLLYDTCESGSLAQGPQTRGLARLEAVQRMIWATGRTTLTAATDNAPALEGYRGHGVFSYAILRGLSDADSDKENRINVTDLAAFVDKTVPEISEQAFHQRQVPQMSIVGSNFPLAFRLREPLVGTPDSSGQGGGNVVAAAPTHVLIEATDVSDTPGAAGSQSVKLGAGSLVRVLETRSGWSRVARDGRPLGYVPNYVLVAVH